MAKLFKDIEMLHSQMLKSPSSLGHISQSISERMATSRDMIENCKYSSMMLLNLINDILDLAKHEKFVFALQNSYFNLIETVNRTFSTLAFLAEKKNIKCILSVDRENAKFFENIYGDKRRYE